MKIGLLWPDYWPYIRRGTERMVHDISSYLLQQGHEVHIVASKPGPGSVERIGRLTIHRLPQVTHPVWHRFREVHRFDIHGLMSIPVVLRERFDLIHAFINVYGPGLLLSRWLQHTPSVYHVVMIPPTWNRRFDGSLLRASLAASGPVRVFSRYCAEHLATHHGTDSFVVPPTVDLDTFYPHGSKDLLHPRILYTADLVQPPKGAFLLALAFNEVIKSCPGAILQLAGPVGAYPPAVKSLLSLIEPGARGAVEMLGPGALRELPRLYAEAGVTVLPSRDEPFGMVLTESLASGTVVVGTNSGAIPEIISDPAVGVLFERNDDVPQTAHRLAMAVLTGLECARHPAAVQRCREHARQWSWDAVGPAFEQLQTVALRSIGTSEVSA